MVRTIAAAVLTGFALAATAQPPPKDVRVVQAFPALRFEQPLFLTAAPGETGILYVVTQGGQIFRFDQRRDVRAASVFLDIGSRVRSGGEEGLLGLAFHPDYAKNRLLYVYYTARDKPRRSILSRFRAPAGAAADPGTEEILLEVPQPYANHNGGMIAFGPDRMLYVGLGDGGSGGDPHDHGQRLDTLLGKILRLTPDGKAAADNPFAKTAGARPEIWAYGLRNPWRFSFDRATGALWAGDVGQNRFEEIDLIVRGGNYGWRLFEGHAPFKNPAKRPAGDFIAPVHTYGRDQGQSVTGGYVYRGTAVPALAGAYVYADFPSGRVWALFHDGKAVRWNRQLATVPLPSSFGEDAAGELYITSFDGHVYTLEAAR